MGIMRNIQDWAERLATVGTWGISPALHLARQDFQALLLQGGPLKGKVLVVGGCCSGASSLSSAELFNPDDNSWHSVGKN